MYTKKMYMQRFWQVDKNNAGIDRQVYNLSTGMQKKKY